MANGSGRIWIWKSIAGGSIKAIASHIVLTYAIPVGLPALTMYAGYVQGLPWMYIMLGGGIMFAAVSTGLLRLSEWNSKTRINYSLQFANIRIGKNINGPGMSLGVGLVSKAIQPIEFEVIEARTRLNNRVPSITKFDVSRFVIPAGGTAWFDDHTIDIGEPPRGGTIEGFAEFKLKYGRVGVPQYELVVKKQVIIRFNEEGLFEGAAWNDAV